MGKIIKHALANSFLTVLYIFLVGSFFRFVQDNFSDKPDTFLAPIFMLTLFVFSAALTWTLVFGRPISWYLNGKKNEAVRLLFLTIAFLFLMLLIVGTFLFVTI